MILTTRALAAGTWRATVWLALGMALAACQSLRGEPETGAADGWRVLERLGDARYRPPGAGSWTPAIAGSLVPAASRVTTGNGGRVILAAPGTQISARPGSAFALPLSGPLGRLEQESGRLRIRVAGADAGAPLVVRTPFLGVLPGASVFEVLVSATATEVTVESGELRVVTPDGERQTSLVAGQSVYAAQPPGEDLAVHLPHDRSLAPAVVPAMRPHPDAPLRPAPPRAEALAATKASGATGDPVDAPSVSVAVKADVPAGSAAAPRQLGTEHPGEKTQEGDRAEPPVERPTTPYERLTDGMARGLPAAAPVPARRPAPPHE